MKRIITICAVLSLGIGTAFSQNASDALRYSENNYYGTARTMAMGNAFTALGGDTGAIGINPAGSAVAGYSQVTVTPGISIVTTSTTYDTKPVSGNLDSFNSDRTRGTLPNLGVITTLKTGNRSGLKSHAFGVVMNATNLYHEEFEGSGTNDRTSMLGSIASWTDFDGYNESQIQDAHWATFPYPNELVAYDTGMMSSYNNGNNWIAATEVFDPDGTIRLGGPLDQRYNQRTTGTKYDVLLNYAMNFNDQFYIGANLGLVAINSRTTGTFDEVAINPYDFMQEFDDGTTLYFDSSRYRTRNTVEGDGVYGKFGFLWVPTSQFRLGAAIQTPTTTWLREKWYVAGDCLFTEASYDGRSVSDEYHHDYRLVSPYRLNAGLSYVFPGIGMISADYEMTDYSTMKYKSDDDYIEDEFWDVNNDIKDNYRISHAMRFGAEICPQPMFAIRAGYTATSSPEKGVDKFTQQASLGLGIKTNGSFFFDFAIRGTFRPDNYFYPYDYPSGTFDDGTLTPEMVIKKNIWDVVATLGWRF